MTAAELLKEHPALALQVSPKILLELCLIPCARVVSLSGSPAFYLSHLSLSLLPSPMFFLPHLFEGGRQRERDREIERDRERWKRKRTALARKSLGKFEKQVFGKSQLPVLCPVPLAALIRIEGRIQQRGYQKKVMQLCLQPHMNTMNADLMRALAASFIQQQQKGQQQHQQPQLTFCPPNPALAQMQGYKTALAEQLQQGNTSSAAQPASPAQTQASTPAGSPRDMGASPAESPRDYRLPAGEDEAGDDEHAKDAGDGLQMSQSIVAAIRVDNAAKAKADAVKAKAMKAPPKPARKPAPKAMKAMKKAKAAPTATAKKICG